jgi:hypothetical protein
LSVDDHVDTKALVANVLLYDRLVAPVWTEEGDRDERAYWDSRGGSQIYRPSDSLSSGSSRFDGRGIGNDARPSTRGWHRSTRSNAMRI